MKFTLKQFGKGQKLVTVGTVDGSYEDLAKEALRVSNDADEAYPLATSVEAYLENEASDNGYTKEQIAAQDWRTLTDCVADDVMHTNSPFIYNGNNRQITKFHARVYNWLNVEAVRQCEIYFNKKEVTEVTPTTSIPSKNRASGTRTKAVYPGIYFRPTKADPKRWVAYGIEKGDIIGYFTSEKQAFDAKKKANKFLQPQKWVPTNKR